MDKTSFACFCDKSGASGKGAGKGPLCRGAFCEDRALDRRSFWKGAEKGPLVFCEAYNHRLWIGKASVDKNKLYLFLRWKRRFWKDAGKRPFVYGRFL